jgi:hypothetical protein
LPRFHHPDKMVTDASAACPCCCLVAAGDAGAHHRSADPRRVRHRLVAVPGIAVVATLAGAASYRGLGSAAAGLPGELLSLPGARWDLAGLVFIAPGAGTPRRVLIALDAYQLDRAMRAWLRGHAGCDADGWAITLDELDCAAAGRRLPAGIVPGDDPPDRAAGAVVPGRSPFPGAPPRPPRCARCRARWTSPGRW